MTLWRPRRQGVRLTREERAHRWRHFWRLAGSYWVSNQWKVAVPTFLFLVALRYGGISTMVWMARWEKALFDALEGRRVDALSGLVVQFLGITSVGIILVGVQGYFSEMLKMRWRAWLTADYMERWLRQDRYLDIERTGVIDNPDQRIAEDLDLFSAGLFEAVFSIIAMTMGAVTFGAILLAASDPIRFSLGGTAFAIPGDLVIYGVLYAVLSSWLMTYVGKPLVRWTIEQQHLAANFRFRLVNVRRNAEQIAFARTVASEWRRLTGDFGRIVRNFRGLLLWQQTVFGAGQVLTGFGSVLPIFLLMPKYLANRMTLGTMMEARANFGNFNSTLSYIVQAYASIATLVAVVARIRQLDAAIGSPTPSGIMVRQAPDTGVMVDALSLSTPAGAALATIPAWRVAPGDRWTVRGPSGVGKSTLLRAVAGIWPYGQGMVTVPGEGHTMFVSQRTFLPIGTLKEAICFPAEPEAYSDEACAEVLATFRLAVFADELHVEATWQDRLSPGEQQRLAFARVLLQRPDLLVLDEATSALDRDNADHAYQTLLGELPGLTLISVVHDPELDIYHDQELRLERGQAVIRPLSAPDANRIDRS